MLLNEGMSIRAHGGTLWRAALKAINCRVMSDTNILLLKLAVDTGVYVHSANNVTIQEEENYWKNVSVFMRSTAFKTNTDALKYPSLDETKVIQSEYVERMKKYFQIQFYFACVSWKTWHRYVSIINMDSRYVGLAVWIALVCLSDGIL
jgi:hypothetical protein